VRFHLALILPVLGLCALAPRPAAAALFDDLGGASGMERIVDDTVSTFLADPRVRDDFDNINPDRLRTRLRLFLCQIADGPCHYPGRDMHAAHQGLELTQAKFNAVAEDLQRAMAQVGIGYWTQNRLLARLAPLQRQIVTK
jgi:hemoglobin